MTWRSLLSMVVAVLIAACGSSSSGTTPAAPVQPGAPQSVYAVATSRSAMLTWTAPAVTGGVKILSYTVIADPSAAPVTTSSMGATIGGLTNGTPYVFEVTATTENGTGPGALSNIIVPGGGLPPAAPIGVVAVAGDGEARVSWAAPASPGASAITGYYVTVTPGGTGQLQKGTSVLIQGLSNGTTYIFSVEALNGDGAGPNTSSNPVTPEADAGLFDGGDATAADGAGHSDARAPRGDASMTDAGDADHPDPLRDAGTPDTGRAPDAARDARRD